MGHQIVKQPNGKLAVWSSQVDDFTVIDVTAEEIIEMWVDRERQSITERVNDVLCKLNRGEKPYFQFTQSFNECLQDIQRVHGNDAVSLKHFLQSGESGMET